MRFLNIHLPVLRLLCVVATLGSLASAHAADQCNTTAQCKSIYGSTATDCLNSHSTTSICMCANKRCDSIVFASSSSSAKPAASSSAKSSLASSKASSSSAKPAMLGRFNPANDLLLAFFDTKPDVDDIHSQAGLATILKNSNYAGVKYYAITGTYGNQKGSYIDASSVMKLAFPDKWMRADGSTNRANALAQAVNLAYVTLSTGGKVWVQEAGQSDFSADMVRELKAKDSKDSKVSFDTKKTIFVVQHSTWNEDHTNAGDLSYIKANTTYTKIDDGNAINNTTGLNTQHYSSWTKAKSDALWKRVAVNAKVKDVWAAARSLASDKNKLSTYSNKAVADGGFDFSDTVESLYIFGKETSLKDIGDFLDEFLEASSSSSSKPAAASSSSKPAAASSSSAKPVVSSSSSKPAASSSSSKSSAASTSVPQPPASCSNVAQSIPSEVLIHTILDKKVSRPDFPQFSKWYTEKDNVQRFQLHEGDQNTTSDILRPRVEAYVPAVTWRKSSASVWHEFSANYYLNSWDTPQLYAVFQIKTNDASNFIVQGLIDKDGSLQFALRGKGRQKVADNVFGKPFNLRVRSNGRSLEIWVDCKRVVAADHPQPELETDNTVYGWRWGLYRQQTADDKQKGTTTLYVTGPKYN